MTTAFTCPSMIHGHGSALVECSTQIIDGDGVATRRFRKDAITAGYYVAKNPIDGKDLELWISNSRMDGWVENFKLMQANGVKVDLTVDHKKGAEAKRGEIVDMYREGDVLYFECEVADDASADLVTRCPEVSIEFKTGVKDGKGNVYTESIVAITVCRNPVVPGQDPFILITASREDAPCTEGLPILSFSRTDKPNPGAPPMFTTAQLAEIRTKTGLEADADDKAIVAAVMLSLDVDPEPIKADLATAEAKIVELSRQIGDLKEAAEPIKLSRDVEDVLTGNVDKTLDQYVAEHRLTPACADLLKPILKGGATMLSRDSLPEGSDQHSRTTQILDALAKNDPAKISKLVGEATGSQTTELSLQTKDDGTADLVIDAVKARADARG